jgi:hypothetical protein
MPPIAVAPSAGPAADEAGKSPEWGVTVELAALAPLAAGEVVGVGDVASRRSHAPSMSRGAASATQAKRTQGSFIRSPRMKKEAVLDGRCDLPRRV